MKILMVLDHEFPPDIRVENEIEALTAAGHEVHVACYTMKGRPAKETHQGAHVHRKHINKLTYKSSVGCLKFPLYFHFWKTFLTGLMNKNSFNAIHVHDLPLASVGFEIARKNNIPFTLDLHENWPALLRMSPHTKTPLGKLLSSNTQWERYEKKYVQLADHVIVVVEEAKDRLKFMGVKEDKITVVGNTLNLNHFDLKDLPGSDDKIVLAYAGGISEHRGLQFPIIGLKKLKGMSKKAELWILGEGSYTEELKRLAQENEVSEHVEFFGWKPYNEMQEYLAKADICIIPHIKSDHTDTTIPHKLFQYMYAGKPIIASDCAPIKRIVEKVGCGLIYHWNQPEEFAACVSALAEDPSRFREMKNAGKKGVESEYLWENDRIRLNTIYQ